MHASGVIDSDIGVLERCMGFQGQIDEFMRRLK